VLRSGSGTGHRGHRDGVLSSVGGGWGAMARTPDNHDCASVSCASVSSDSRPCGRRCLAVWPLESGRVASGLSPRGVSSFVHARLGVKGNQGRMVCNLPGPCPTPVPEPQWCPMCPHPAGLRLPFWRAFMVLSLHWWRRATSHGGRRRKCDVRYWIRQSRGGTAAGLEAVPAAVPPHAPRT